MKTLMDKLLSPRAFAIGYLPWLAINMMPIVNILNFTRVVLIAFAVWAVAIAVKQFFFDDRKVWTHKGMALLLVFLGACLLSQALQFRYGGFDVLGKLCYFAVCLLILYPMPREGTEEYVKLFGILARVLGVVIGIAMLISDWMFIEVYSGSVIGRGNGAVIYVGFAENRLFGLFSSANVGGTYALILILCSLLTILWSKHWRCKVLWRVLAGVQIFLAAMYISVGLSRGTYVSGLVLVLSYMMVRPAFKRELSLARWKQIAIRAGSALVAMLLCVGLIQGLNKASCAVMRWNYERKVADNLIEDNAEMLEIIEKAELGADGRTEAGREDIDFTNKRASIWSGHLKLLRGYHLLIGVNHPEQYMNQQLEAGATFDHEQLVFVDYAGGNLHNGYLQILVNGGLLAFIPMMIFLVLCAVKAVRYLAGTVFSGRLPMDTKAYAVFSLLLPMVLAILVNNVFETNFVLMGANFFQAFFWLIAGACIHCAKEGVTNE